MWIFLALQFITLFGYVKAELGYAEIHLGSATVIKSPDYPKSLGPQVQMEWSVSADMGYRIKVIFQDFNLPANHDCKQLFLNIAEGDSTVMNKSDNRICGAHPAYFVTKTSKVSIFLRSDSDPKRGALKNFVLRLEKTREKPTNFAAGQWSGKPKPKTASIGMYNTGSLPMKRPSFGSVGSSHGSARVPTPAAPPTPIRAQAGGRFPAVNPNGPHKFNNYGHGNSASYGPQAPLSPRGSLNVNQINERPALVHQQAPNYGAGSTGHVYTESGTSKLEVQDDETPNAASYALPLGLLAMVILLAGALFLVKRFLISGKSDEKGHDIHR